MAIIIFDFDDTVFDTKRLNSDVAEGLVSYGADCAVVLSAYDKAKTKNGVYYLNGHIAEIEEVSNIKIPEDFFDWFEKLDFKKYVLPDIVSMLESLKNDHKLILLTKGEENFQTLKINRADLAKHFEEIHITEGDKEIYLESFNFTEPVIFINDKHEENQKVQEKFPHFRVSQKYEKED